MEGVFQTGGRWRCSSFSRRAGPWGSISSCGGAAAERCWLTAGWLSLEPAAGEQNRSGQVAPEALEKWGWERRLERLGKEQRDS